MISGLHKPIRVGAVFEIGLLKPVWIDINGKKIVVKNIFYKWIEKFAYYYILKFSLSDEDNIIYEIEFDPINITWHLNAYAEAGEGFRS